MLHSLSVFPPKPNTFSERAALEVTGASQQSLDALVDCGLVECSPPDRYCIHQVIADYAAQQRQDDEPIQQLVEYARRLADQHQDTHERLERERRNLMQALELAYKHHMHAEHVALTQALLPFIEMRGMLESHLLLERAVQAARSREDLLAVLEITSAQARLAQRTGDYDQAQGRYQEALQLAKRLEARAALCVIHRGLGTIAFNRGQYERAQQAYDKALGYVSNPQESAALLTNMGALRFNQGAFADAQGHFEEALRLARVTGKASRLHAVLINLGVLSARKGDYQPARAFFEEGLELAQQAGDRRAVSFLLANLGALAHDEGDFQAAQDYLHQALEQARDMGDRERMCHNLASLGALAVQRGDVNEAARYLQEGLEIAGAIGHQEHEAVLLANRGALLREQGRMDQAAKDLQRALTIAEKMGHPRLIMSFHSEIAELELAQDHLDRARQRFADLLNQAKAVSQAALQAEACFGLARTCAKAGDLDGVARWSAQLERHLGDVTPVKGMRMRQWLRANRSSG